jgi:YhcH/YjgK/YiaL family protein
MVLDRLTNAGLYAGLAPRIAEALEWLRRTDLASAPPGNHEIRGKDIFAIVAEYVTKPRAAALWEAHRKYIDVQYVVRGNEMLGHAHIGRLAAGPYDEEKEYLRLEGDGDLLSLPAGSFAILWPDDAHMPGVAAGEPAPVKKVVVKVAV